MRGRSDRGGDQGIVLVYTALMITFIIGFAGFSVDFGRWYLEASRVQNATDAAALGGVVFVGTDFESADEVARELMASHGFTDADQVTVEYGDSASQIRVTATSQVDNMFASIFGVDRTTIKRSALAEYLGPVPLGSPQNHLGNDPDGTDQPDYWLNIAGPRATKISGDRFAAKNCDGNVARCDPWGAPNNLDYEDRGYFFTVGVDAPTGDDLSIELFDGIMAYVGDFCEKRNLPGDEGGGRAKALANADPEHFADAEVRYKSGHTGAQAVFCTGDQDIGGKDVETTIIVREPDDTPWLSTDNPVVPSATCQPVTLGSYDTSNNKVFAYLNPNGPYRDTEAVFDPTDGMLTFAETFRRWAPVCTIPGNEVVAGEYLVQIRTNAAADDPLEYDPLVNTGGHNRFSMRAGFVDDDGDLDGAGVKLFARGKFPIYANAQGADTEFYLARVDERYAGRSLNVVLFDAGDASDTGTLRVLPPEEATDGSDALDAFSGCDFFRDDKATLTTVTSECELREVKSSNGFNGRIVEIVVPIPEDYTCDEDDAEGCWLKVLADFPGGVSDTTTWSAEVIGDPVRLVE